MGPCSGTGPAIKVVGPATLRLNGWTVSCEHIVRYEYVSDDPVPFPFTVGIEGSVGIAVVGRGAHLLGGGSYSTGSNPDRDNRVMGCGQNVVVGGAGGHQVKGVTSTQDLDGAFVVTSDSNEIIGNVVKQQFIAPDPARPVKCGGIGFTIEGTHNEIHKNVAADCVEHGFEIEGNENLVQGNVARDNHGFGFKVEHDGNTIYGNVASKNVDDGFFVEGNHNTLSHNASSENGDGNEEGGGDGFEIQGDENVLEDNIANANAAYGIALRTVADFRGAGLGSHTPMENHVSESAASYNGLLDLLDDNARCGTNQWHGNIFGTRNRSCIK